MLTNPSIIFFGTSEFAVYILEELKSASLLPHLIVTTPDKPQGRKLLLSPSPVKEWALKEGIKIYQPNSLKSEEVVPFLTTYKADVFIVASYGKILPQEVLDIPARHTLNVHPSLLPLLRGPAPIETAILSDMKNTGVTIMRLDAEMDHGPIVVQEKHVVTSWPTREVLEKTLGHIGGALLARILPSWIAGTITETPQKHTDATYTRKIQKEDALISLEDDPYTTFLKIKAFSGWPRAYFFIDTPDDKKIRLVITEADFKEGALLIKKVIPEGKKEMSYEDFLRGK